MTTESLVFPLGATIIPSPKPESYRPRMSSTAVPNRSSATLPISLVGTPSWCRASPVLETTPPVVQTAGPIR